MILITLFGYRKRGFLNCLYGYIHLIMLIAAYTSHSKEKWTLISNHMHMMTIKYEHYSRPVSSCMVILFFIHEWVSNLSEYKNVTNMWLARMWILQNNKPAKFFRRSVHSSTQQSALFQCSYRVHLFSFNDIIYMSTNS